MDNLKFQIELNDLEQGYFRLILGNQISKYENIERGFIERDFIANKKLLLAYFGKKWNTFRSWYNTNPYHLEDEYKKIAKTLLESYSGRRTTIEERKLIFKLYLSLCNLKSDKPHYEYVDLSIEEKEKWKELMIILDNLGIHKSKDECQKILSQLTFAQI